MSEIQFLTNQYCKTTCMTKHWSSITHLPWFIRLNLKKGCFQWSQCLHIIFDSYCNDAKWAKSNSLQTNSHNEQPKWRNIGLVSLICHTSKDSTDLPIFNCLAPLLSAASTDVWDELVGALVFIHKPSL